jgi:hypothetical protein
LPRQAQDRQTSRKLTKKDCFVPAGIFNEAAYTGPGGDFAEHNDWVVSKMMWCDATQTPIKLSTDYSDTHPIKLSTES